MGKAVRATMCTMLGGPYHDRNMLLVSSGTVTFSCVVNDIAWKGFYNNDNCWEDVV